MSIAFSPQVSGSAPPPINHASSKPLNTATEPNANQAVKTIKNEPVAVIRAGKDEIVQGSKGLLGKIGNIATHKGVLGAGTVAIGGYLMHRYAPIAAPVVKEFAGKLPGIARDSAAIIQANAGHYAGVFTDSAGSVLSSVKGYVGMGGEAAKETGTQVVKKAGLKLPTSLQSANIPPMFNLTPTCISEPSATKIIKETLTSMGSPVTTAVASSTSKIGSGVSSVAERLKRTATELAEETKPTTGWGEYLKSFIDRGGKAAATSTTNNWEKLISDEEFKAAIASVKAEEAASSTLSPIVQSTTESLKQKATSTVSSAVPSITAGLNGTISPVSNEVVPSITAGLKETASSVGGEVAPTAFIHPKDLPSLASDGIKGMIYYSGRTLGNALQGTKNRIYSAANKLSSLTKGSQSAVSTGINNATSKNIPPMFDLAPTSHSQLAPIATVSLPSAVRLTGSEIALSTTTALKEAATSVAGKVVSPVSTGITSDFSHSAGVHGALTFSEYGRYLGNQYLLPVGQEMLRVGNSTLNNMSYYRNKTLTPVLAELGRLRNSMEDSISNKTLTPVLAELGRLRNSVGDSAHSTFVEINNSEISDKISKISLFIKSWISPFG